MDTGRAGTIYGLGTEQLIGLSYFQRNGFLPRGDYKKRALHAFPAADFTLLDAGGSWAASKASGVYTVTFNPTGRRGTIGWNFGADKTKALFIMTVPVCGNTQVMFLHDAEPNTNEAAGANGIGYRVDGQGVTHQTGRISSGSGWNNGTGWTQITGGDGRFSTIQYTTQMSALYVDTAGAGVVKAFTKKLFEEWTEVCSGASNHLAQLRCASVLFASGNSNHTMHIQAPMAIFAE